MRMIAAWPVVSRNQIVRAFRPGGSPTAEGPFRTLRRHQWASAGVRVSRHADHGLAGQMTLFSSLNVESARLARDDKAPAAERVARAAADLESGPEFTRLRDLLAEVAGQEAERVVYGVLPQDATDALGHALRALAARTEQVRVNDASLSSPLEASFARWIAGHITEVHETYVLLAQPDGPATAVPRWMADAAHRNRVGGLLMLVTDKFHHASAVVEAVPAIDVDVADANTFSPFDRGDTRSLAITTEDAQVLAGKPLPLRIVVPVQIEQ
jgi:hypothetical protein